MYDNHVTGQLIREIRIEKGITQEVLSGLAAVSVRPAGARSKG